jgi:hypothetical protein
MAASDSSEARYVATTVREILDLVKNGKNGGVTTQAPLADIDPTKNVLDKVSDVEKRLNDLRNNDKEWGEKLRLSDLAWQGKLDAQKQRSDTLQFTAEQSRTDALRAGDAAAVATALVQVSTATAALATATATQNDTTNKAIVALQLIASSSGGTLSGRELQQAQTRAQSNWSVSQWISIAGIAVLAVIDLHSRGVI